MIKTITIVAYNRPGNLTWLLQTLEEQLLSLDDYRLCISIDSGGGNFKAVKAIAEAVTFMDTQVVWSKSHLGMNKGTYESMRRAFEDLGADFNVYLEEDYLLSPDAFNLVEWYISHEVEMRSAPKVKDIAAYCLFGLAHEDGASPTEVVLSKGGGFWGFVMSQRQWQTYAKKGWFVGRPEIASGKFTTSWDKRLAIYISTFPGVYRAFPVLSRTSNTGKTHIPDKQLYAYDEVLKVSKYRCYNQQRKAHLFCFTGIAEVGQKCG